MVFFGFAGVVLLLVLSFAHQVTYEEWGEFAQEVKALRLRGLLPDALCRSSERKVQPSQGFNRFPLKAWPNGIHFR